MAFTALEDGRFLNVNDAFTTITGFQRNEVLGRTSVEIGLWFDPEERARFIKLSQQHGGFHEEEVRFRKKNGEILFGIWSAEKVKLGGVTSLISVLVDITERKKTQEALRKERDKLRTAISEIKTLSGLVPICSHCKNIRDDKGYWNRIEKYIGERSDAQFSHGICPECAKKFYSDIDLYPEEK
jgi:PAS domain S-box-containing protein